MSKKIDEVATKKWVHKQMCVFTKPTEQHLKDDMVEWVDNERFIELEADHWNRMNSIEELAKGVSLRVEEIGVRIDNIEQRVQAISNVAEKRQEHNLKLIGDNTKAIEKLTERDAKIVYITKLMMEKCGITITDDGTIVTEEKQQENYKHWYLFGFVTGGAFIWCVLLGMKLAGLIQFSWCG